MSSAQVIQLFRAAAFGSEGIEKSCAAYDLAPSRLHDRNRCPFLRRSLGERVQIEEHWTRERVRASRIRLLADRRAPRTLSA
jgi:hypothetical protein